MTVERILPCVCCDNLSSADASDLHEYGMPILIPNNSMEKHKQFWTVKCPRCGRGGMFQYTSAYLALKDWNDLIKTCRRQDAIVERYRYRRKEKNNEER